MGILTKETKEIYYYEDQKGEKKPLTEMNDNHLVNALLFAQRELDAGGYKDEREKEDIEIFKAEILRRMNKKS